ncbi:MAG: hypothetical protein AAFQ22_13255 [Pseudomonadota bacterium]
MRLTVKRLEAMQAALNAMLAGCDHEGDWPEDVTREALDGAHSWVCEQLRRRRAPVYASDALTRSQDND